MELYRLQLVREKVMPYNCKITNVKDVRDFCISLGINNEPEEVVVMLAMDALGNIVGVHEISRGTLVSSLVSPANVMKRALLNNAYSIILVHNHPSGDSTPSRADIEVTERLSKAAQILDVVLHDHIIIGFGTYYSFKENGYL